MADTKKIDFKNSRMINNAVNELLGRAFSDRLGRSWYSERTGTAKRDIYNALGYIKNPVFDDYWVRYKRGDIGKRIIKAPVDATWRLQPTLSELKGDVKKIDTPFEKEWALLVKDKHIYHYLSRADRISGIGRFGILLLGLNDGAENLSEEVIAPTQGAERKLLFLMPYSEKYVRIQAWDVNPQSERYGLPDIYQVTMRNFKRTGTQTINVHHSRILHLAEDTDENDVYGTPRLEAILNRLQDLETVAGGSGEMFWRGALPGFNFKIDSEADVETVDTDDLKNQIDSYVHGLQRFIRTQGLDVQTLSPQVSSPKDHVDVQLTLISATTGIPKRILEGSERGELASSQDETNWNSRVDERRENYAEPMILRRFVDKLIDVGVLTPPSEEGYSITWPSLFTPGEKDRAETAVKKTDALSKYVNAQGADEIIPPEIFLRDFLEYDDDRIQEIETILEGYIDELSIKEEEELIREQRLRQTQIPMAPIPGGEG